MKRDRRVKDMTGAVQRFRRRVLANIDARVDALWHLEDSGHAEARAARRALARVRQAIEGMR